MSILRSYGNPSREEELIRCALFKPLAEFPKCTAPNLVNIMAFRGDGRLIEFAVVAEVSNSCPPLESRNVSEQVDTLFSKKRVVVKTAWKVVR
jgi:hypothetical protein